MSELRTGWLSLTGEFYPCGYSEHISVANELSSPMGLPDIDPKTLRRISGDDKLLNVGWVYIGVTLLVAHEWHFGWRFHLTGEQIQFLRPYFEDGNGIPVNRFCLERWRKEIDE